MLVKQLIVQDGGLDSSGNAHSPGTGDIANDGTWCSTASNTYGSGWYIIRVSSSAASSLTSLNSEFSSAGLGTGNSSSQKVDYSKFFFNGVPDGKYSLASKGTFLEMVIEKLGELVDFLIGMVTYLFRVIIVDIVSIFDRLLNNTVSSLNDSPRTLEESGVSASNADDPKSENRSVTIEGLVFDQIDLFDINIFKVD